MASLLRSLFKACVTTCGFIGMSLRVPRSSISLFQLVMRFCAFSRKLWSLFVSISGRRALERSCNLRPGPHPPDGATRFVSDRCRSARPSPCLAWGKTPCKESRASDDQRVTLLQGILGGGGAEQPDSSRGVGAVIGHDGFAEQRFDDRAANAFASSSTSSRAWRQPLPANMATFEPLLIKSRCLLATRREAGRDTRRHIDPNCVWGCLPKNEPLSMTSIPGYPSES